MTALALSAISVFGQQYEWGRNFGGTADESVRAMTVDEAGNSYLTGYFTESADFDPGENVEQIQSNGFYDAFIQKLDSDGNLAWVKSFGGQFDEYGAGIDVDSDGAVLITGAFSDTIDFDPGPGVEERGAAGGVDLFALKLDANGEFLWVFTAGNESNEEGLSIRSDGSNNVYIAGYFSNTIEIQAGLQSTTLESNGSLDGFGIKLDGFGQPLWAVNIGGPSVDLLLGMDVNEAGDVFYTGNYSDEVDFNPGDGEAILNSGFGSNGYVLKLNALGEYVYAADFGGDENVVTYGVAVDQNDNVFASGGYRGNFVAGDVTIDASGAGDDEAFVVKINPFGGIDWAKHCGGNGFQQAYNVATDSEGNAIMVGYFDGTADFDPGDEEYLLSKESSEPYDSFVTILNPAGEFIWAGQLGGTNFIENHGVGTDGMDNIYISSSFQNSQDINPLANQEDIRDSQAFRDLFITKMNLTSLTDNLSTDRLQSMEIYPNPATNLIFIQGDIMDQKHYRIYDQTGRLVQSGQVQNNRDQISLELLNSGIYLLQIEGFKSVKVLKQ